MKKLSAGIGRKKTGAQGNQSGAAKKTLWGFSRGRWGPYGQRLGIVPKNGPNRNGEKRRRPAPTHGWGRLVFMGHRAVIEASAPNMGIADGNKIITGFDLSRIFLNEGKIFLRT
ncbi:MAG: hypothetical protein LBF58_07160 [Deltaproteobacteria bacterium]|jgi:hypothetical protein|nr:hypothetical protein [Deltaproteobacteria bacterium]